MSKIRFFQLMIVCLVVLNIGVISFVLIREHTGNKHRPGANREIIIGRLHFDEQQVQQYEGLIQWHRSRIHELESEMMAVRTSLYSTLNADSAQDSSSNRAYAQLAKIQVEIEQVHLKHFQDIHDLCKPAQQKAFEELSKDLPAMFGPPKGPPPHRR